MSSQDDDGEIGASEPRVFRLSRAMYVEPLDSESQRLSGATGFLVRHGIDVYVVTCWHVVARRNFFTDEASPGDSAEFLRITLTRPDVLQRDPSASPFGISMKVRIRDEETFLPIWKQAPRGWGGRDPAAQERPATDVVAIPLQLNPQRQDPLRTEDRIFQADEIFRGVMPVPQQVSIPGFPFRFTAAHVGNEPIPVCKTGYLASAIFDRYRPSFLIDINTHPGMSGAPIWAIHPRTGEQWVAGIYSGMIHPSVLTWDGLSKKDSRDPGIALGWYGRAILEVIEDGVRPADL